jgi:hypothetical protein
MYIKMEERKPQGYSLTERGRSIVNFSKKSKKYMLINLAAILYDIHEMLETLTNNAEDNCDNGGNKGKKTD